MEPNERPTAVTFLHFPKEGNHKLTFQVLKCEEMLVRTSARLMQPVLPVNHGSDSISYCLQLICNSFNVRRDCKSKRSSPLERVLDPCI